MIENQENENRKIVEQQGWLDNYEVSKDYSEQNNNFDKMVKWLLRNKTNETQDDIPEDIRAKLNKLIEEHNHENQIIKMMENLEKTYWDKITLENIITNILFITREKEETEEYIENNYKKIIGCLSGDNINILWNLNTNKDNLKNGNETSWFISTEFVIPTNIDKNDYEESTITTYDTIYWYKESRESCVILAVQKKASERKKSKIREYEKSIIQKEKDWEKNEFTTYSTLEWYGLIWNLQIEPTNEVWKWNWEPLYKISFKIYTPKENDGQ